MKVTWSLLAVSRVTEIAQYIAQDSPSAALKWAESIFQAVEHLKQFPEIGRVIPEIKQEYFREIIHGNYRIIYRIESQQVSILTVRHGKQILPVDEVQDFTPN